MVYGTPSAAFPASFDHPPLRGNDRSVVQRACLNLDHSLASCHGIERHFGNRQALGRPAVPVSRRLTVYLCHILFSLNYTELGLMFGHDRTTIRRFCHAVEDMRDCRTADAALNALEFGAAAWATRFHLPGDLT